MIGLGLYTYMHACMCKCVCLCLCVCVLSVCLSLYVLACVCHLCICLCVCLCETINICILCIYIVRTLHASYAHSLFLISTRPFLNTMQKKWIAFQLLKVLDACHGKKVHLLIIHVSLYSNILYNVYINCIMCSSQSP